MRHNNTNITGAQLRHESEFDNNMMNSGPLNRHFSVLMGEKREFVAADLKDVGVLD